ncbi:MAG: hypothetical protein NUW37_06635 [Planctomycetes bacterium]|nr:hypothetical protein [Planctomycetota bacterium]
MKYITISSSALIQFIFVVPLFLLVGCIEGTHLASETAQNFRYQDSAENGKDNSVANVVQGSNSGNSQHRPKDGDEEGDSGDSEELERRRQAIVEKYSLNERPSRETIFVNGFDWDMDAIRMITMASMLEDTDRFSIAYFNSDGALTQFANSVRRVQLWKSYSDFTLQVSVFDNSSTLPWELLVDTWDYTGFIPATAQEFGLVLHGNALVARDPSRVAHVALIRYSYNNIFLTCYDDIDLLNPPANLTRLVDFVQALDTELSAQPVTHTVRRSEYAPEIKKFRLSEHSVAIGDSVPIEIEIFNPLTGKSIPEYTLEEAGLSVAWNQRRPMWMWIVDDVEDYSQNFGTESRLSDYQALNVLIQDEPDTIFAPDELSTAVPGEYELGIKVFNERGLISDASIKVRVTPPRDDGDHDRGHGNDDDHHDEDNPGRGHGDRGDYSDDHDRGHGNDDDRHDEDNPGRG